MRSILAIFLAGLGLPPARAQAQPDVPASQGLTPVVSLSLKNDLSLPLRDIAPTTASAADTGDIAEETANHYLPGAVAQQVQAADDALQLAPDGPLTMPAPLVNLEGVNNLNGVLPPDTNGDIGYDPATGRKYYLQWVNMSYQIWDVTDPAAPTPRFVAPISANSIWKGFGGNCESRNDGDPIVLFDPLANRWLMSQFAVNGPYHECVAISVTGDRSAV